MAGTMKWADVEEDDFTDLDKPGFETPLDHNGVKTVTEYLDRNSQNVKVTRKVKVTSVTRVVNKNVALRKNLPKFGQGAGDCRVWEDEIIIEPIKRNLGVAMDEYDRFLETEADTQIKDKKGPVGAWTSGFRNRTENPAEEKENIEEKKVDTDVNNRDSSGKYVPPSVRNTRGLQADRLNDQKQREDFTLRVTNLADHCKEGDLMLLFGSIGRVFRIFLGKNQNNESKGFAFVTYCNRQDAEMAVQKLNGHGYDNLILNVAFTQPRPQH